MGFLGFITYKERSRDPIFKANLAGKNVLNIGEKVLAVAYQKYTYANVQNARDHKNPIHVEVENKKVSRYIQSIADKTTLKFFVVPGYIPPFSDPMSLNPTVKKRLNWAVKRMKEETPSVVLVSGGNVKPEGTPYNEALEMKKHLMKFHEIPEHLIAIDPYAQNTVTNLRNAGRFMRSHGINDGTIVTTYVQNTYIGFPTLTLFHWRSRAMLGYEVGELQYLGERQTHFKPSQRVFDKGPSKIDP